MITASYSSHNTIFLCWFRNGSQPQCLRLTASEISLEQLSKMGKAWDELSLSSHKGNVILLAAERMHRWEEQPATGRHTSERRRTDSLPRDLGQVSVWPFYVCLYNKKEVWKGSNASLTQAKTPLVAFSRRVVAICWCTHKKNNKMIR